MLWVIKLLKIIYSLLLMLLFSGCSSPNLSSNKFTYDEAAHPAMIRRGIVISKRTVTVDDLKHEGLIESGTVIGGVAGYSMGNDASSALLGSALGYLFSVSFPVTSQNAVAYMVELESSKIIRVIQSIKDDSIEIGENVLVEYSQGMRVNLVTYDR